MLKKKLANEFKAKIKPENANQIDENEKTKINSLFDVFF